MCVGEREEIVYSLYSLRGSLFLSRVWGIFIPNYSHDIRFTNSSERASTLDVACFRTYRKEKKVSVSNMILLNNDSKTAPFSFEKTKKMMRFK